MQKCIQLRKYCTTMLLFVFGGIISPANATLWTVDAVLHGSDGQFGYSGFHDASTGSVMSGAHLGSITGTGSVGTFDDATGYLDINVHSNGGATRIHGYLDFGGQYGFLQSVSDLNVNFSAPLGLLQDTLISFLAGDICCGGNNNAIPGDDPNSFVPDQSGGAIITLWGANGYTLFEGLELSENEELQGGYQNEGGPTTLGMDLRLQLSEVPEPSAMMLLGIGLFGMRLRRAV